MGLYLLPWAILTLMFLGVLIAVLLSPRQTGSAYDRSIFHKRVLQCDTAFSGPQHTLTIGYNDQFCVLAYGEQYPFVLEGSGGGAVRLLLYHEPYQLFLLQRGAEKQIDLDGDGEMDITVTALSLSGRGAELRIVFPSQLPAVLQEVADIPLPSAPPIPDAVPTLPPRAPVVEQPRPTSQPFLLLGGIAAALILLIIAIALIHHHKNSPPSADAPPTPPKPGWK